MRSCSFRLNTFIISLTLLIFCNASVSLSLEKCATIWEIRCRVSCRKILAKTTSGVVFNSDNLIFIKLLKLFLTNRIVPSLLSFVKFVVRAVMVNTET
jgi:hypothetical protein